MPLAFSFMGLGLLAGVPSAQAACPGTIASGETETSTQALTDGQNCTIEEGGAIETFGKGAIDAGDNTTITNDGNISAEMLSAGDVNAISAVANTTVENSGAISATVNGDGNAVGIRSSGDVNVSGGGDINATTSGNGGAYGILNVRGDATTTVYNTSISATVSGNGDAAGVYTDDGGVAIVYNSTIKATVSGDGNAYGILSSGSASWVNNSTSLIATVSGDGQAYGFLGNGTVINSGLIQATVGVGDEAWAIYFEDGAPNALTLDPGSRIIGRIRLGDGPDTITFQNRVSTVLTFDDDNGGLPEEIHTNGLPYVVSGTTVAVLDPSAFNQHDEMLSDLTSGIFNSVHARLAGSTAPVVVPQAVGKGFVEPIIRNDTAVWAQAFGGWRNQDNTGPINGADHNLVGGIAGVDGLISPTTRIGAFGGLARDEVSVHYNSQDIDADSYFGGVYASFKNTGWFADMILTAGQTDHDSKRRVMYNLSDTGMQTGRANYDGTFISPEVAVGTRLPAGTFAIEPSLRVRYAHMSLDGYSETGAVDGLSVRSRDISLWQGRAQIAFPWEAPHPGGVTKFAPRLGIEGWTSDNGNVSAVLLGEAISFNPGGEDDEVTGFVGATGSIDMTSGLSALIDGEVHVDDDGYARAEARAGITINF
ncbi:MAG: autotransporter domain-containing protein [Hyphomicrobium sp.]|nr:autotransporter domain-containing protein [Hyphomicrobium sp.]